MVSNVQYSPEELIPIFKDFKEIEFQQGLTNLEISNKSSEKFKKPSFLLLFYTIGNLELQDELMKNYGITKQELLNQMFKAGMIKKDNYEYQNIIKTYEIKEFEAFCQIKGPEAVQMKNIVLELKVEVVTKNTGKVISEKPLLRGFIRCLNVH